MVDFICPFCDSSKFYKNGFKRGKQRYKCFDCKKCTYTHYPIDFYIEKQVKLKSPISKTRLTSLPFQEKPVVPFKFENDLWDIRALREVEQNERIVTINFSQIKSVWLKEIIKQYIKQELLTSDAVSTATGRIIYLRPFCLYIETQTDIQDIEQIDRKTILNFLNTTCTGRSWRYIQHLLGGLRDFFNKGNLHGWFKISEHLIRDEDYPKPKKGKPKDIPNKVLEQIENNLHQLPDSIS